MRGLSKCLALAGLLACAPAALAQDAADAPPAHPLTPKALVGKSVRDLERGAIGAVVKDDIKALRRGPLLIHGNYCGVGNRPGTPPIDALDAACMRHDACTSTGAMPSCACDDRLRLEATDIARDPTTPADLKVLASATAASMAVLICKEGPAPVPRDAPTAGTPTDVVPGPAVLPPPSPPEGADGR